MLSEKGLLRDTPAIRLLLAIFEQRLTGILYLKREETLKVLYFNRGKFTWAISNADEDRLETMLIDRKLIDGDTVELFRKSVKAPESLGKTLVENGLITLENLVAMTRVQLERIVASVLAWTSGGYQFVSDTPPERLVSLDMEIPIMVHHCVQEHAEMDLIWKEIGTLQLPLQVTADAARLTSYPLSEYQKEIIAAFRSGAVLETVLPRFAAQPRQSVLKSVYFLLVAGLLVRGEKRPAPPPPDEPPAPDENEVTGRRGAATPVDHEPLPGETSDWGAPQAAVRAAAVAAGWDDAPPSAATAPRPAPEAAGWDEVEPSLAPTSPIPTPVTAASERESDESSHVPVSIDLPGVDEPPQLSLRDDDVPDGLPTGPEGDTGLFGAPAFVSPSRRDADEDDFLDAKLPRQAPPAARVRTDLPRPFTNTLAEGEKRHRLLRWAISLGALLFILGGIYLLLIRSNREAPPPADSAEAAVPASRAGRPEPARSAATQKPVAAKPVTVQTPPAPAAAAARKPETAKPVTAPPTVDPAAAAPKPQLPAPKLGADAWGAFRRGNLVTAADIWREEAKRSGAGFTILIELDCQKESVGYALRQFAADQQGGFFLLNRRRGDRTCWLVLWGRFAGRAEAESALPRLPAYFFRQPEPPAVLELAPYL